MSRIREHLKGGNMPNEGSFEKRGPIEGIRVLDLSHVVSGPFCGRCLADHGAEVIKIERYPLGDMSRYTTFDTFADGGRGPLFVHQNLGKKGMCINLKNPDGVEIVKELVKVSDVVLESFTPGTMSRLGLGYEDLKEVNPEIILCSISGFGQVGPNSARPGYGGICHAMTGWLGMQFLHRNPPEEPRGPGIAIADIMSGLAAFGAIGMALLNRERTGRGEHIDISIFDAMFGSNDFSYQSYLLTDQVNVFYHPVNKTKDGYMVVHPAPDFQSWEKMCKVMGHPELADDERFCCQIKLKENLEEAGKIVKAWLANLTTGEAERLLMEHHIPCGRVYRIDEAVKQPQVEARNLVVEVDDPVFGRIRAINTGFKYMHAVSGVSGPAPLLGEHNEEILSSILGYSKERIQALIEKDIVHEERK